MVRFCTNICLLVVLMLFWGCVDWAREENLDDLNLDIVTLGLSENELDKLYKGSHVNEWVSGILKDSDQLENVKVRRQGNEARKQPKISIKITTSQNSSVLSSQFTDKSLSRYIMTDFLFRKAGFDTPEIKPVGFVLNDKFNGVYLKREVIDSTFFEKRSIPVSSVYKANFGARFTFQNNSIVNASFTKKYPKGSKYYGDLEKLIVLLDKFPRHINIGILENIIDIENVLDYIAVSSLTNNFDCITYNFYIYYDKSIGKFRFIPWDLDKTFAGLGDDLPVFNNGLFEKLLQIEEYSDYVERRKKDLFDPVELKSVLSEYAAEIERAYRADPYLNGREFEYHQSTIHTFIDSVTSYLNR